jgi:hypothetical protein
MKFELETFVGCDCGAKFGGPDEPDKPVAEVESAAIRHVEQCHSDGRFSKYTLQTRLRIWLYSPFHDPSWSAWNQQSSKGEK